MSQITVRAHLPLFVLLPVLSTLAGGCGGFQGVAVPTLSSVSPSTVIAGSAGFTLTVTGTNFMTGTQILWDGDSLESTVVSSTQLTTLVPADLIALSGTVSIRVMNPDTTTSGAMQLTITEAGSPNFYLSSISPSSVAVGSSAFTLTATGLGFASGCIITLDGAGISTTYISATELQGTIPAASLTTPATISVAVLCANNAMTNSLPLTVTTATGLTPPTLTSLNPSTVFFDSPTFTLTATGTGFVANSLLVWNGTAMPTTFVSSTEVTAVIADFYVDTAGVAPVNILNPGNLVSNTLPFTIAVPTTAIPKLTSLTPNEVATGSAGFTLLITGFNFAPGAVAYWGNMALKTTYVRNTILRATIPAGYLVNSGTIQITAKNANSGLSNALPFGVGVTVSSAARDDLFSIPFREARSSFAPPHDMLDRQFPLTLAPVSLLAECASVPCGSSEGRFRLLDGPDLIHPTQ